MRKSIRRRVTFSRETANIKEASCGRHLGQIGPDQNPTVCQGRLRSWPARYYRFHTNQTRKPTHATNSNGSPIKISGPNITEDIPCCHRGGVGHGFFIEYHLPRDLVAYAPILAAPCLAREEYAHPMSTGRDLPVLARLALIRRKNRNGDLSHCPTHTHAECETER